MKRTEHPEIVLPDDEARRIIGGKTRRSLLVGGVATLAGAGLYAWVRGAQGVDNVPWPQREVLDFNGRLARAYLSENGRMPLYRADEVGGVKANGNYGLAETVSASDWKVRVELEEGHEIAMVPLRDIAAMPKMELITRFCCIEGWSGVAQWGGVAFADFTQRVFPRTAKLPRYVYMATANEEYYVGLDMKSALHPQTLLAWEQNGKPLEVRRGAPLRLAIPVKYGIKNIKQLALVRYTDTRPGDYWAEEGYDWFAGL